MKKRRPTQTDVAKLAGVSQSAVSQVLYPGNSVIPQETRQRVFDAVKQLKYVPNRGAQSLRTQKTFTIASIIPDITNPFYPAFQRGIQSVTNHHGFDLIVYDTDERAENEERSLQSLVSAGVDGAIVSLFHHDEEHLIPIIEQNIPIVFWRGKPALGEELTTDTIFVDNISMAKTAASFLIKQGHSRIGMIAGLKDTHPRQNRVKGFYEALSDHDLPMDDDLIQGGDFTEMGGYQSMKRLLELSPQPTAVFAANDLMALGAMLAIREAGLRIPQDIALIGLDDIPAAKMVYPPLTTITQFQGDIGRRAAELLFDRINGIAPADPRLVEMPFDLIIRESV